MNQRVQRPRSHLFTVRVWQEEVGSNQTEWRGKVQLITDGSVHYFHGWDGLVPLLVRMLSALEPLSEPNP